MAKRKPPHLLGIELRRTLRRSIATAKTKESLLWRNDGIKSSTGKMWKKASTAHQWVAMGAFSNIDVIRTTFALRFTNGLRKIGESKSDIPRSQMIGNYGAGYCN